MLTVAGQLFSRYWHPTEKRLPAPKSLLRYLVERPDLLARSGLAGSSDIARKKRELLLAGDVATREEALAALEGYAEGKQWYVFEGATSVDAYLETKGLVILIEGKRTESGPTTSTTWMAVRHQILRNLDAARDAIDKPAVGLFIVQGREPDPNNVPPEWKEFARETVSASVLEASLPHRTPEERDEISRAFLGVTTWQRVCVTLEIPPSVLLDEVATSEPASP